VPNDAALYIHVKEGLDGNTSTALVFLAQTIVTRRLFTHATMDPGMSSSSSVPPGAHTAGANGRPPEKRRKLYKQKPTGAKIALAAGAIQPGNCADIAVAAETVCGIVGKSTWTKKNSTSSDGVRSFHLCCFSEKPAKKGDKPPGLCPFVVTAIEGDKSTPAGHVRIKKYVSDHLCSQGHGRKRGISLNILKAQCPTIESFVVSNNRLGGNMHQLQQMVREQHGVRMEKGQVYKALEGKTGDICTHLASYRLLHSWIAFMEKKDPEGTYVIQVDWFDGHAYFRYLFAAPSATKKVHSVLSFAYPLFDLSCVPRNITCAPGGTWDIKQPFFFICYVPPGVHISPSAACHVILRLILSSVLSSSVCHVMFPVPPGLHVTSTSLSFHPCMYPRGYMFHLPRFAT